MFFKRKCENKSTFLFFLNNIIHQFCKKSISNLDENTFENKLDPEKEIPKSKESDSSFTKESTFEESGTAKDSTDSGIESNESHNNDDPPTSGEATLDDSSVNGDESASEEAKGMSFLDHLDELRKRIIYSLIGIAVGMGISGFFVNFIIEKLILNPAIQNQLQLQNLKPFGQPVLYFKIIFVAGIVISLPFTIFQLWRFISPGLYENEKKWGLKMVISATLSFLAGITFAYFVMLPLMVAFAANFGSKGIQNIIDVNEYLSFFTTLMIGTGLVFELPVLSFILAQFGVLNSKFLQKYWRHAMILILIVAAVITPTPDPVNQSIFAIPLFLLYEVSVLIVKRVEKRKAKQASAQQAETQQEAVN